MLSAFVPVEFYDYRPAPLTLSNLKSGAADLCNLFFETESVESISCMHTIEHVGLGRYGDPIDADGDIKAINELKRVVKKNGHLIFVTPVGLPRIQYNAHRIYSYEMVMDLFKGFKLNDFSLVLDNGDFISPAKAELVSQQRYGCGCFWFSKM
jgi:SAM-dependent methyltransferase